MLNKRNLWPILGLLYGAVTWGLIWYPYRRLGELGIQGEASTFLTYVLCLLFSLIFLRKHLKCSRASLGQLVIIALAAGWTNLAYVLAVMGGEVMRVLLLFYLAPLWTVVFSRTLLNERLDMTGYLVMLFSFAGAMVMLWSPGGGMPLPANQAEWLALSAGFMFAFSNVLSRRVHGASISLKSVSIFAGVLVLSAVPMVTTPEKFIVIAHLSNVAWMWVMVTAIALFAVTLAVQYGLAHTPANQAIIIFLSELVVAAISAYYLANEVMTVQEWLGGAMIVVASLFSGKLEKGG